MYGVAPFYSVFYLTCTLGSTYVSCVSPNAQLLIQYVLYIISLKTLDLPFGEGALTLAA